MNIITNKNGHVVATLSRSEVTRLLDRYGAVGLGTLFSPLDEGSLTVIVQPDLLHEAARTPCGACSTPSSTSEVPPRP